MNSDSSKTLSKKKKKRTQAKKQKASMPTKKASSLLSDCNDWMAEGEYLSKQIHDYSREHSFSCKEEKREWQELSKHLAHQATVIQRTKKVLGTYAHYDEKLLEKPPVRKKKEKTNWVGNGLFYLIILAIVFVLSGLFAGQSGSGAPRNIAGYAPMTVLTKSMDSVYPKDSLIITKVIPAKELAIGDDITFLKENNTTVTHRIIGIEENYMETGKRGFTTKGVDNPNKDEEVVRADNVIGKVIFSNAMIGRILLIVRENMVLTAILLITTIFFMDALIKYISILREPKHRKDVKNEKAEN